MDPTRPGTPQQRLIVELFCRAIRLKFENDTLLGQRPEGLNIPDEHAEELLNALLTCEDLAKELFSAPSTAAAVPAT